MPKFVESHRREFTVGQLATFTPIDCSHIAKYSCILLSGFLANSIEGKGKGVLSGLNFVMWWNC